MGVSLLRMAPATRFSHVSSDRYSPNVVKFVHTADWQLGRAPLYLSDDDRARFRAGRIDVIDTIGKLALREQCDFVVVSGDVFEWNNVERQVLVRALEKMGATPRIDFYLLPGNHDPLDASSIFRSQTFRAHRPGNVTVLDGTGPVQVAPGVELVASPWPNKRPLRDLVDDACKGLEPCGTLRIVVGHGVVDTMSPSTSSPALISLKLLEERIESGIIHYAALGDRHSKTEVGNTGRVWYSGAPEPTDFDETEPGNVLIVSLDRDDVHVDARRVSAWCFERADRELGTDADIEALEDWLKGLDSKDRTITRVDLTGQVSVAQRARLDDILAHHADLLACLREDSHTLAVVPDDADRNDYGLSGYAQEALDDLFEMAASGDRTTEAQDALSLLYRLVGAGQ